MASPIVSVVIPVRNYERYIAASIESVLAQTFRDWELIIVDDCSTDRTPEIISHYADDPRVRSIRNQANLGQFPAHNRGAELAQGRYIKFFHGDDIMYPHCLETMVALMEAFPEAGLGISYNPGPWLAPHLFSPIDVWRAHLASQIGLVCMGPSGTIFRAEAFRATNGFDGRYHTADMKLNLTTAMTHPVLLLSPGLWWYRRHENQTLAFINANDVDAYETIQWLNQLLDDPANPLSQNEKASARGRHVRNFLKFCFHRARHGRVLHGVRLWKKAGLSVKQCLSACGRLEEPRKLALARPVPNWRAFHSIDPILYQDQGSETGVQTSPYTHYPFRKPSTTNDQPCTPLVSVLIPACNAEDCIAGAIESVLAQRFSNWELIVVDDCSTDRTAELAKRYSDSCRIRLFQNERTIGKWQNHNRCAELARGKYLKFLNPADLFYPHALQTMVSLMEYYGDARLGVACDVGIYRGPACLSSLQMIRAEFFATPMLDCSLTATIIRRDAFMALGGLHADFSPCDRHLQLSLANEAPVVRACRGLVVCDAHKGHNQSQCGTWPLGWAQGCDWLVKWLLSGPACLPKPERHDAAANVLRYLWDGACEFTGQLPLGARRDNRALALRLAREADIPDRLFRTGPRGKRGWTAAMQEEERLIACAAPDLAAFLCLPKGSLNREICSGQPLRVEGLPNSH